MQKKDLWLFLRVSEYHTITTVIHKRGKRKFHIYNTELLAIGDLVSCRTIGHLLTNQYSAVLPSLLVVYTDRLSPP